MTDRQVASVFGDPGVIIGDLLLDPARCFEGRQGLGLLPVLLEEDSDVVITPGEDATIIHRVGMGRGQLRLDRRDSW